jgi:HAD superfamily hydrolase (TIGR01509 family)
MIKAVIFDMNGIIIDDEHIHELALKETVKPFNIDLSHQDYLECCAGKTDNDGYVSISKKFSTSLPIAELLNDKARFYLKLFPEHNKTFAGVIELIGRLADNFTLALTSGASRAEVDLITKEYAIDKYFKITISADEVKKGKPDPEPYLITCNLLKLKPQECVVIEDSKSGVLSAKAAGCFCIGVTTTHSENDLEGADKITDSFEKVEALISNLE